MSAERKIDREPVKRINLAAEYLYTVPNKKEVPTLGSLLLPAKDGVAERARQEIAGPSPEFYIDNVRYELEFSPTPNKDRADFFDIFVKADVCRRKDGKPVNICAYSAAIHNWQSLIEVLENFLPLSGIKDLKRLSAQKVVDINKIIVDILPHQKGEEGNRVLITVEYNNAKPQLFGNDSPLYPPDYSYLQETAQPGYAFVATKPQREKGVGSPRAQRMRRENKNAEVNEVNVEKKHNPVMLKGLILALAGRRARTEEVDNVPEQPVSPPPEKPAARTATHFIDLTVKLDPPGKDQPDPYLELFHQTISLAYQETIRDYFLKTCFPEGLPESIDLQGTPLRQIIILLESETDATLDSAMTRARELITAIPDEMIDEIVRASAINPSRLNRVLTMKLGLGLRNLENYLRRPDMYITARNALIQVLSGNELKKIRAELQDQIIYQLCSDFVRAYAQYLPERVDLDPIFHDIVLNGVVTETTTKTVLLGFKRTSESARLSNITKQIQNDLTAYIQGQVRQNIEQEATAYIPQFIRITTTQKDEAFIPLVVSNWRKYRDTIEIDTNKAEATTIKQEIIDLLSFIRWKEEFKDLIKKKKPNAFNTVVNLQIAPQIRKDKTVTDQGLVIPELSQLDNTFWQIVIDFCDSEEAKSTYNPETLAKHKKTAQKVLALGNNGTHPFVKLDQMARQQTGMYGVNLSAARTAMRELETKIDEFLAPYFPDSDNILPKPGQVDYQSKAFAFVQRANQLQITPEELAQHIRNKEQYRKLIIDRICNMAPAPTPVNKKDSPPPPKPVAPKPVLAPSTTPIPPAAPKTPGVPKPATPAPKTAPPVVEKIKSNVEIVVNQELATIIDKLTITETTNPNFAAAAFKTALVNTLNSTYKPLIEMAGHTNAENLIKDPRFKQMVDSKLQSATDKWKNIKNGTNGAGSKQATSQGRLSSEQVASIKNSPNGRNGKEIKNGNLSREQLVQQLMQIIENLKIPADTPPEEFSLEVAFEDALNAAVSSNPALKAQLPRNDSDYFALYQLFSWDEQSDLENALKTKVSQWLSTYKVK